MKLSVAIVNAGRTITQIDIDQGEPLSIPLQNPDGSAWDTTNTTVETFSKGTATNATRSLARSPGASCR